MHISTVALKKCLSIVFLLMWAVIGEAQIKLPQIKTVIPAIINDGPIIVTPSSFGNLSFDLSSIPAEARIQSCKLQLVLNEGIRQKMLMAVRSVPGDAMIFNTGLDISDKAEKIISINISSKFFDFPNNRQLNVALKTQISNTVMASFFRAGTDTAGKAPRLIVYYTVEKPTIVNWASARANAQHTSQTPNMFKDLGITKFETKKIDDFGGSIADLIMYNDLVYVVANKDDTTTLYAIDPVTKSRKVVAGNIKTITLMPVIDPYGRLYYLSENKITAINLSDSNKLPESITIPPGETVAASPTIAADGSLYIVTNSNVYAYSPFPHFQLLWRYAVQGIQSGPVSINKEATIAYIVSYNSDNNNSIIAINADNGRKIAEVPVTVKMPGQTVSATLPLVNLNGYIFVADNLINATNIDVFDSMLNKIRSVRGAKMSSPVMGGTGDAVYFVKDNSLFKYAPGSDSSIISPFTDGADIRSVATDMSGNIYCLGMDGILYSFDQIRHTALPTVTNQRPQTAMIIAPDGSLYFCSSSALFAVRGHSFKEDYTLSASDYSNTNVTFRSSNTVVPDTMKLTNRKKILGSNSVVIGKNVTVDGAANISIVSGGTISFNNGFTVKAGATFSCKTGY